MGKRYIIEEVVEENYWGKIVGLVGFLTMLYFFAKIYSH